MMEHSMEKTGALSFDEFKLIFKKKNTPGTGN